MMDGYWGYNGMDAGTGIWGFVFMVFMMALVVAGIVVAVHYFGQSDGKHGRKVALDILEKRFASGEIDTKEFEAKRKILSE